MTKKQRIESIKRQLATLAQQVEYIETHDDEEDSTLREELAEVEGHLVDAVITLEETIDLGTGEHPATSDQF